jgi:hypothetical protein
MRAPGKITTEWLDSVLMPRHMHQVIGPAFFDERNPRHRPQKLSTIYLKMALNDYATVRGLLLEAGQHRLARGVRDELVDALAKRWEIQPSAILAVIEGHRRDPR